MAWRRKRKGDLPGEQAPKTKLRWPTRKRGGEAAEAAFLAKATCLGFGLAKTWGDSDLFDFVVHSGPQCWRVQVKSANEPGETGYFIRAGNTKAVYTKQQIDFLVAYIVPVNAWYVIPVEALNGKASAWFSPRPGSKSRFERYREAWCLMACPRDGQCKEEIVVERKCAADAECPFQRAATLLS
jgi:PD-(D/E)XK endonuclease